MWGALSSSSGLPGSGQLSPKGRMAPGLEWWWGSGLSRGQVKPPNLRVWRGVWERFPGALPPVQAGAEGEQGGGMGQVGLRCMAPRALRPPGGVGTITFFCR